MDATPTAAHRTADAATRGSVAWPQGGGRGLPARRPRSALVLLAALAIVATIGVADYLTGFEISLAILYVIPVALATWSLGALAGGSVAALSTIAWAVSFAQGHDYTTNVPFYWDVVVLAGTLALFVGLLDRLRAALERSDERFVRVLDGLMSAVFVTDARGQLVFANRRLATLLGVDAGAVTMDAIRARFPSAAAFAEPPDDPPADLGTSRAELRDDATQRWYLVQSGGIPWIRGGAAQLTMLTDVTDRKRAEILQRERESAAHHAARLFSTSETAAMLAHELNQPLSAIVGYNAASLRLLAASPIDAPEIAEAMEKCRVQAVRAGGILNRMRELARRRRLQTERCDVNAVVRQTLGWIATELEAAGVDLAMHVDPGALLADLDPVLIEQLVQNLVRNAIDAMRDTPRQARRLAVSTRADGAGVVVSIADAGCGIPAEAGERVYAPFFTSRAGGLGLGLAICRSIVEMHGGRLWHEPRPGGGTIFHFSLPRSQA